MRSESGCGEVKKTSPKKKVRAAAIFVSDGLSRRNEILSTRQEFVAVNEGYLIIIIAARILVVFPGQ